MPVTWVLYIARPEESTLRAVRHMVTEPLESLRPLAAAGRYRPAAIAFHWTMFVLVVVVGVLGLLHDDWPKQTQAYWINVHALLGLALWAGLVARFGYRIRNAPP